MAAHLEQWLADQIADCGVDVHQVRSEWSSLCQHEVVTFSDPNLPHSCLSALVDLSLTFPSEFVFATDDLQSAFQTAVSNHTRMLELMSLYQTQSRQHLEELGLSAFAQFDPADDSLEAFARRVEAACGLIPGSVLMVDSHDRIIVAPARPQALALEDVSKLIALLNHAAPDVDLIVRGQDSSL